MEVEHHESGAISVPPSDRMGSLWSLPAVEGSVILEYSPAGINRIFTTYLSKDDVVMGDVSRLEGALVEVDEGYHPQMIYLDWKP